MDFNRIHEKAVQVASDFKRSEKELIEILEEVNRHRVYFKMGYKHLFSYCVEALKLPANQVYYFNGIAKKAMEVPELKAAVTEGRITVSAARRIVPVISRENSNDWLGKAATLPQKELERAVAKENPKLEQKERIRAITESRSQLVCGISVELENKLERVKDLLSQKKQRAVQLEEALLFMADEVIQKFDPLEKARRQRQPISENRGSVPDSHRRVETQVLPANIFLSSNSRFISARSRRAVWCKYGGKCAKPGCDSRRWLDIHHIIPVSAGGTNEVDNLELLCSAHHRLEHSTGVRVK